MSETAAEYISAQRNAVRPTVRRVRLRAMLDGRELPGLVRATVNTNGFYKADTFSAQFSLYAPGGKSLLWWSDQADILLDIQCQFEGVTAWQSLIIAESDHIQVDPTAGSVQIDGRDLSARFIESKTQENCKNKTSSEVVSILASRHFPTYGITANVTPTTTLSGRYYEIDYTQETAGQFSHMTTEWDLLVYLARKEGFDLYMQGRVLHFHPSQADDANPFAVYWRQENPLPVSNVIDLRMERSLTLAKDIQVDVRSWSSKEGRSFVKTAKAIRAKFASASSKGERETQRYTIVRPNLTEVQAQDLANRTAHELSSHERIIAWAMPGEFDLNPRRKCRLNGTQSSWDQTYFIDTVSREISFDAGFVQHVHAKNHSPLSEVLV